MQVAKEFWREARTLGVALILLAVFYLLVVSAVNGIKSEINSYVRAQCVAGTTNHTFHQYDDVVRSLIEHAKAVERAELRSGRSKLAAANAALAARLESDLIPIVKQDCSKPLLP